MNQRLCLQKLLNIDVSCLSYRFISLFWRPKSSDFESIIKLVTRVWCLMQNLNSYLVRANHWLGVRLFSARCALIVYRVRAYLVQLALFRFYSVRMSGGRLLATCALIRILTKIVRCALIRGARLFESQEYMRLNTLNPISQYTSTVERS